jgi:hypothetical protein
MMKQSKWISLLALGLISCAPAQDQRSPEERFPLKAGQVWILNADNLRPLGVTFKDVKVQLAGPITTSSSGLSAPIRADNANGRVNFQDAKLNLQVNVDPDTTTKLGLCTFTSVGSTSTQLEGTGFAVDTAVTNSGLTGPTNCTMKLQR